MCVAVCGSAGLTLIVHIWRSMHDGDRPTLDSGSVCGHGERVTVTRAVSFLRRVAFFCVFTRALLENETTIHT